MKIAMLGQKGMPAHSGGIEQHVDILSRLLVARGHEVIGYCRRSYCGRNARTHREGGLLRRFTPGIATKHLDAITHTATATLDVVLRRADVVHFHGIGPGALTPLARAAGLPVVTTVHSFDWRRAKWNWFARNCLRLGERLSTACSNRLVVVSPLMRDYYQQIAGVKADFIPNAVLPIERAAPQRINHWNLDPAGYVLAVARLEPGKGLEYLVEAFSQLDTAIKLVIAGGSGFDPSFEARLRRVTDPRIIFTGAADRALMSELYSHARMFVLPSDSEGMSIALLEAMSMGLAVVVSDIPENTCVVEDAGFTFRKGSVDSLRRVLQELIHDPELLTRWGIKAAAAARPYRWPTVVDQLEQVYAECAGLELPKQIQEGEYADQTPRSGTA